MNILPELKLFCQALPIADEIDLYLTVLGYDVVDLADRPTSIQGDIVDGCDDISRFQSIFGQLSLHGSGKDTISRDMSILYCG